MVGPSGEQFEIELGDQRAVVVEVGGGLRTYRIGERDLLAGYEADEMAAGGRGQMLIPWPNRLQDGSYEFGGRRHQLALTEPEAANAIHGLVRWARWTVTDRESQQVVMEHVLPPQPGYPFSLALEIEYRLSSEGLSVRTKATNTGREACPFGCGAHPYLTLGTPTVDPLILCVPGGMVLRADKRGIPVGREPVEGTELDFRLPRPIAATRLDHAFAELERGDDGKARVELRHPDGRAGLTLWMDESYPYVMVFTGDRPDVERRGLAVEPMTCPPNAFRTGEDLVSLEPGQSVSSTWGISPEPD